MEQTVDIEKIEQDDLFEHHRFIVDAGQSPLRIDKFLMNRIENASRSKIQNAALAGSILVNNKTVKSNYLVKPNDVISIVLTFPPRDTQIYPENIPLSFVFEDDDIAVINKNAGMVVHPGFGNFTGTLVNALLYHFNNLPDNKNSSIRPGLVHRIDKDTSGLLVIAKNELAMTFLAKQFFDHSIKRTYKTLVWGNVKSENGTIKGYIGRDLKNRKIMCIYEDENAGKASVTHFKVIERFGYVTLVECNLETGRTHQIRAHMKHIGHTIFNDKMYGGDKILKGPSYSKYKQFIENCFKIIPHQALHANTLGFIHPSTKKEMFFEAKIPDYFNEVLEKWRRYSHL